MQFGRPLLLALLALSAARAAVDMEDVNDVFDLTVKVFGYVAKSWEIVDKVDEHVGKENTPQVWFTKKRERLILNNFGRITHIVSATQRQNDEIRSVTLGSLKKLQSLPNAVLNGIQINELLESVRSIENDLKTMEGACVCVCLYVCICISLSTILSHLLDRYAPPRTFRHFKGHVFPIFFSPHIDRRISKEIYIHILYVRTKPDELYKSPTIT